MNVVELMICQDVCAHGRQLWAAESGPVKDMGGILDFFFWLCGLVGGNTEPLSPIILFSFFPSSPQHMILLSFFVSFSWHIQLLYSAFFLSRISIFKYLAGHPFLVKYIPKYVRVSFFSFSVACPTYSMAGILISSWFYLVVDIFRDVCFSFDTVGLRSQCIVSKNTTAPHN